MIRIAGLEYLFFLILHEKEKVVLVLLNISKLTESSQIVEQFEVSYANAQPKYW